MKHHTPNDKTRAPFSTICSTREPSSNTRINSDSFTASLLCTPPLQLHDMYVYVCACVCTFERHYVFRHPSLLPLFLLSNSPSHFIPWNDHQVRTSAEQAITDTTHKQFGSSDLRIFRINCPFPNNKLNRADQTTHTSQQNTGSRSTGNG